MTEKRECKICKKKAENRSTWNDFYCDKHWKKQKLYDHKLPFSKKLKDNVDALMLRIKNKKASMIIIDGCQGSGKTTLAIHIADYVTGANVEFEKVLAMGGSDFSKKIRLAFQDGYVVVIYDESGDFNKRASLTRLNALMNRVFETFRALKILVILCLPSFNVLDNSLFAKGIPRTLLHCERYSNSSANVKAYSLWRCFYLIKEMKNAVVPPQAYGKVRPNYFSHFLDLSPKRATELDVYSVSGKLEVLDLAEIHSDGLQTYSQISLKLNRSIRWVQIKMKELGLEEKKTHKQKKYFNPEVVDIIAQHLDGGN